MAMSVELEINIPEIQNRFDIESSYRSRTI